MRDRYSKQTGWGGGTRCQNGWPQCGATAQWWVRDSDGTVPMCDRCKAQLLSELWGMHPTAEPLTDDCKNCEDGKVESVFGAERCPVCLGSGTLGEETVRT